MTRSRAPAVEEYDEMHLRIMVEEAVRSGMSEREIEALLMQVEADDRQALRSAA